MRMNAFYAPSPFAMSVEDKAAAAKDIEFFEGSTSLLPEAIRPAKVIQDNTGEALLRFSSADAARGFQAGMEGICGNSNCYLKGIVCASSALFKLESLNTEHPTIRTGKTSALTRLVEGLAELESPGMTGNNNTDVAQDFLDAANAHQQKSASAQR